MPLLKDDVYTVEDIYALPDGQRAELIDGEIFDMAPPSRMHQRLVTEISTVINQYIKRNGGSCEVDVAPFAVFLSDDDRNYVEPDITVVCEQDKLSERGCEGAPDWIIEIVSPGSRKMDYMIKLFRYRAAGVRLYWIVDPEKQNIRVYDYKLNETQDYCFDEAVPVGIYPEFSIRIDGLIKGFD